MTADSGSLNGKTDPDELISPIKRLAGDVADAIENIKNYEPNAGGMFEEEGPYRPNDPDLYDQTSFKESFMDSAKQTSAGFINSFRTALFRAV